MYQRAEDGIALEAVKIETSLLAGSNAWKNVLKRSYQQSYDSPVVI